MLSHLYVRSIQFLQISFITSYDSYKTDTASERETCGVGGAQTPVMRLLI